MDQQPHKLIVLKELQGNAPTHLDPIQQALEPHTQTLINIWIAVWVITALVVLVRLGREYLEFRKHVKHVKKTS